MNTLVAAKNRLGVRIWLTALGVLAALCAMLAHAVAAGPAHAAPAGSSGGAGGLTPMLAQFDPTALGNELLTALVVFLAIIAIGGAAAFAARRSTMMAFGVVLIGAILMAFASNYDSLTQVGNWFLEAGGLGGGGG